MSRLTEEGYQWLPFDEAWRQIPEVDSEEANQKWPGYTGVWCAYIFCTTAFWNLAKDIIVVSHVPLSCRASGFNMLETHFSLHSANAFAHSPSTGVDERMVIMGGGADALAEVLRRVDQEYRPAAIVIADTCATYMIQDDVGMVVQEVEPELQARVFYAPSPGFFAAPMGKYMERLGENMCQLIDEPEEVDPEKVNVVGFYYDSIYLEKEGRKHAGSTEGYAHLIEGIGLKPHCFIPGGEYKQMRRAAEAGVNTIHAGAWGYPLAKAMERRFGTPWLKIQLPMGPKALRRWVMELAEHTGREAEGERFVQAEEEKLLPLFEETRRYVEGKTFLIENSRNSQAKMGEMLAYGRLAEELGMKVYVFNVQPIELKAQKDEVESYVEDEGFNPTVLVGPMPYHTPVLVTDVMDDLGVNGDQVVYIYDDVFPYARAESFDPSNTARYTASVQMKRVKGASYIGTGYEGTAATYRGIIEAVRAAQRKSKPTLYGRIWSRTPFEFQYVK